LVTWYKLDEISGTTIKDEKEFSNGTFAGILTSVEGVIGKAIDFTPKLIVSGLCSPDVTGIYLVDGLYNGFMSYKRTDGEYYVWAIEEEEEDEDGFYFSVNWKITTIKGELPALFEMKQKAWANGTYSAQTGISTGSPIAVLNTNYIDTNNTFQSTFQQNFTISVWLRLNATEEEQSINIFGADERNIDPLYDNWVMSVCDFNQLSFVYRANNSAAILELGQILETNVWCLLTFTVSQIEDQVVINGYKNGVYVNSVSNSQNMSLYLNPINLYIGATSWGAAGVGPAPFYGSLDNFMIFNKALNQTEITWLYNERSFVLTSSTKPSLPVDYMGIGAFGICQTEEGQFI